jgi:hypothetical protein
VQGRLSFAPGEISKTISIPIVDDYFAEGSESFTLALGNPNNAILSPQTAATVTINDNDTAQPSGNRMFVAQLTGTQIVPANTSTATGTGILTLNEAETQATVSLNFSGLTGTQSAARIHGPAHTGVNGSTAFTLTTGAVNNTNINLTPVQVQQLKAGLFYFIITTSGFSSGEIRGQILPNPAESARFFVRQQYYDFLNREPDTAGLNYWAGQITATGTNLTNLRDRRIGVSNAFFFELEFQQTGAYVYRLYRAAFGNNQPFPNPENHPDAAKIPSYQVFVSDRSRVVGGGATGAGATRRSARHYYFERVYFALPRQPDGGPVCGRFAGHDSGGNRGEFILTTRRADNLARKRRTRGCALPPGGRQRNQSD